MSVAPEIVMVGASLDSQGGVAAVLGVYRDEGLFERWGIVYVPTSRPGSAWRKAACALGAGMRFAALLLRGGGRIVHVQTSSYASFWRKSLFFALAFLFRRMVVVSLHGGGFREFYADACGPIGKWWVRTVIGRAACFIVLTESWRRWALSVVPGARVRTIPNLCPDPARGGVAASACADAPRVLFLGRLEEEKGFHDLLLAVACVRRRVPGIRLVCGGTGDDNLVRRWIEEAGVGDLVELRGWVSGAAKRDCFDEAALLALPSHAENLPMVIIEAMAAGLPVVASKVGGIPDVIGHDVEGLLVAAGDVAGLAEALARLLLDPALRQRMAHNARRTYENRYSPRRVVPQLEAVYRELGAVPQLAGAADGRI